MAKYSIRMNCEYYIEVEATSKEEALSMAESIDPESEDWDRSWSTVTTEDVEEL